MQVDLEQFQASKFQNTVKAMPVILLLDVSGSMSRDGKIERLNDAVVDMLTAFSKEMQTSEKVYRVAVVTFGTGAKVLEPFGDPTDILNRYQPLVADGLTFIGAAMLKAKEMVENREIVPSYWYSPAVVLLSDGKPEGEPDGYWQKCLDEFCNQGRSGKKTQRFAIALGANAVIQILEMFTGHKENVLRAEDAMELVKLFRQITITISKRFDAPDPNQFVNYGNFNFDNANTAKPMAYSSRRKKRAEGNEEDNY